MFHQRPIVGAGYNHYKVLPLTLDRPEITPYVSLMTWDCKASGVFHNLRLPSPLFIWWLEIVRSLVSLMTWDCQAPAASHDMKLPSPTVYMMTWNCKALGVFYDLRLSGHLCLSWPDTFRPPVHLMTWDFQVFYVSHDLKLSGLHCISWPEIVRSLVYTCY